MTVGSSFNDVQDERIGAASSGWGNSPQAIPEGSRAAAEPPAPTVLY